MNVGRVITASMRAQRRRDLSRMLRGAVATQDYYALQAWLWWGWRLIPSSDHLGMPGATWPWWTEPKWSK